MRPAVLLLLVAPGLASAPADAKTKEYTIKAGFLYNFGKFATWPRKAFRDAKAPFVIGVLGDDPFGPLLDALGKKKLQRRPVRITRIRKPADARSCHILFIARSESRRLRAVLAALSKHPVLTVGDMPRFPERGGVIGMTVVAGKIRLRFNLAAAARAGIRIDPKLIQIGTVVE